MREYVLVAVVAAVLTFVATPLARWIAVRFGAVTPVRGRDVHSVPIPRLGGIAMLLGFGVAMLVGTQLPYLSTLSTREVVGVLAGAVLMCGLGAVDDFRELDALTKFAGQIIAAGVMAFSGVQLLQLPIGGVTVLPQPVLVGLTVLVVLVTTNAVNFVDGLDGLAAGVVAIAALTFFVWAYSQPQISSGSETPNVFSIATLVAAGLVGCCVGFLPHNFHPARLFMGDSGALLLGLLLSAATISVTGNLDPANSDDRQATVAQWLPLALPVAILALPVLDVVMAIIRRRGRFSQPDSKHLHHRMLQIGHTHRRAVLIFYLWSLSIAAGVLGYAFLPAGGATALLAGLLGLSLVLTWGVPRWSQARRSSL
ncbi:MraY family glycosyltransferase [Luteipulveratus sp. YIM 133132]|uniref:MraY family glycosyltransferase n=1 Tax=Luteipulveratus flavus TaxID=3031728 RepID=A0ABT6C9V4_9MICO|nr:MULTISPECIES: MraY family glycosyltransferase [unclassified Luteipulveratus]MDE9365937.1 MraY family glycosyltransferase [Luteipulveratus sp. YIM 133132]MDF8265127.1 MraY family glycosyltransferase [Luteipulveratus sp. YIM 133296]